MPTKPPHNAENPALNRPENPQAAEFWELGLQPHAVSAISGTGTGEMMDALVGTLPPPAAGPAEDDEDAPLAVAIVGRPNVGARPGVRGGGNCCCLFCQRLPASFLPLFAPPHNPPPVSRTPQPSPPRRATQAKAAC
jgi:hypothetical protein